MSADPDRLEATAEREAAELFRGNLALIERVVRRICRQAGVREADADDFASVVNLALIDDGYAVLRAWQKKASLAAYLTVVVQRLLCDERSRARGRWEPSAAAQRGGPAAVLLETTVLRDGRPFEQVLPLVHALDPSLSRADAERLLATFRRRATRPRPIPLDDADLGDVRAPDSADAALLASETHRMSRETSRIVRDVLASLHPEDRMVIRCRFGATMSVADISRMLHLPQRPLYRRIEAITKQLRQALLAAGIDAVSAETLIEAAETLDFGLAFGKSEGATPSSEKGGPAPAGEES